MEMSAAYLSLTNYTDTTIRISHVESPQYDSVQLHETRIENGIAKMRRMPALEVPAGQSVRLQRGGKHLMLMRPTTPVDTVTLQFYDQETLLLTVATNIQREGA
jgi:copper(I)-binding protein